MEDKQNIDRIESLSNKVKIKVLEAENEVMTEQINEAMKALEKIDFEVNRLREIIYLESIEVIKAR